MRLSRYFIPTVKETPKKAQEISHILLLKAGLIKPLMSGVYEYLPLGLRVITKIQQIIREEMNQINGQELLLPILSGKELWEETNRWNTFGDEMFKLKDRNDRDMCLAPTHEEIITDLARREIHSYRQLPQIWYQLQTKFRDEPRPRGAILRMRQFIMKDSYSLDRNEEELEKSFHMHREAYSRIFRRCGLDTVVVGASSGLMGGSASDEFMFLSESGEDSICLCNTCDYAANIEVATTQLKPLLADKEEITEVHTPVPGTVEAVSNLLAKPKEFFIKSLLYIANNKPTFVLVRGDHEINETKLTGILGHQFNIANPDEVKNITGADIGYISPISLENVEIYVDVNLKNCKGMITGANKNEYHFTGVSIERDINPKQYVDIITPNEGDPCPQCSGGILRIKKAIELGHLFKLGTKYSQSMKCFFTDSDGTEKPVIMGSYGIGVERIMAAVIDKYHDSAGIQWPVSIAPFLVHLIPLDVTFEDVKNISERIYEELSENNIATLIDDRDERPGFKFKDADLIGIPIQIIVGKRSLQNGCCEIKLRREDKKHSISPNEVISFVRNLIQQERKQSAL